MRAAYEFETGLEFPPATFEHPQLPFIRASLDGWCAERRQGIEVKMVGEQKFHGDIIPSHYAQVQTQMLVAGVDEWTYIRHWSGQTKVETIKADPEMQKKIVGASTSA
jgi:hypothetical protein